MKFEIQKYMIRWLERENLKIAKYKAIFLFIPDL